jgi:hypothetical protein
MHEHELPPAFNVRQPVRNLSDEFLHKQNQPRIFARLNWSSLVGDFPMGLWPVFPPIALTAIRKTKSGDDSGGCRD